MLEHKTIKIHGRDSLMGYGYLEYEYYQLPIGARIINRTIREDSYNRCFYIEVDYKIESQDIHDEYA